MSTRKTVSHPSLKKKKKRKGAKNTTATLLNTDVLLNHDLSRQCTILLAPKNFLAVRGNLGKMSGVSKRGAQGVCMWRSRRGSEGGRGRVTLMGFVLWMLLVGRGTFSFLILIAALVPRERERAR